MEINPPIIALNPTIMNGGRQPNDSKYGKNKFPRIAPVLPNIIVKDTVVVLLVYKYFQKIKTRRFKNVKKNLLP